MQESTTLSNESAAEFAKSFAFSDLPGIYAELRPMASKLMRGERIGHSLQTTALMHEALIRLMGTNWEAKAWENPGHFIEAFCRNMRYVLVDHARCKAAEKRGGALRRVPLNDALEMCASDPEKLLSLSELLERLANCTSLVEPQRKAKVVLLRVFGNLSEAEIAAAINTSAATVRRDWQRAKAWLAAELQGPGEAN